MLFKIGFQYERTLEKLVVAENKLISVLEKGDRFTQDIFVKLSNTEQLIYGYRVWSLNTTEVFMYVFSYRVKQR